MSPNLSKHMCTVPNFTLYTDLETSLNFLFPHYKSRILNSFPMIATLPIRLYDHLAQTSCLTDKTLKFWEGKGPVSGHTASG